MVDHLTETGEFIRQGTGICGGVAGGRGCAGREQVRRLPGGDELRIRPVDKGVGEASQRRGMIGCVKLPRFRGVFARLGDYGSVVSASLVAS